MSRPSDDFELEELREEYDWMSEFMGRMAERLSGDADFITNVELRIEAERLVDGNAKLRELVKVLWHLLHNWLFKSSEVPYDELDAAYESMKELGVKVD